MRRLARVGGLAALALGCGLAGWAPAYATEVRIRPLAADGTATGTMASTVTVRLVDAQGQPMIGLRTTDGAPVTTYAQQEIPADGEPWVVDLTPQSAIARADAAASYYAIEVRAGHRREPWRVQVPDSGTVQELSALVGGAAVAPADILAGSLLPSTSGASAGWGLVLDSDLDPIWSAASGGAGCTTLSCLLDGPSALGTAGQILATNATATAWEWIAAPTGGGSETDPVFGASAAAGIDSTDVTNWGAAYTASHAAASVADSTSIDLTLTGQQVSAAAIFGTASGTVAQGNHTHVAENIAPTTMVVEYGTLDSGTVAALAAADGTVVAISEVSGANALRVVLTYTGVTSFSQVRAYLRYAGSATHYLALEVYDYVGAAWEQYGTIASSAESSWYFWPIADPSHHVSGGQAQVRIRHIQSGVTSHDLFLDLVGLSSTIEGGTVAHPDLTGRSVADAHPASAITNTPAGNIAATTVQAAIDELDTDKLATGADAADLTSGTATDNYVLTADGSGGAAWEALPRAATWYTWYLGNMTDAVTTGTKVRWIAPAALKISAAHGSCDTAATASSLVADVNDEGTSIFVSSEEIEIEASEKDSLDATTQPNLTNDPHSIQAGDELTFAIDTAPGGACLAPKVSLLITWD